ncbi:MAG: hypothetical protein CMJ40_01110 [Phycisphaerae bacterium]|nr:hypothetical protein [Phycisphaerae bacterium]
MKLEGSSILVTGGAGFIGTHVVSLLHERNCTVRVLELPDADVDHLRNCEIVRMDIRDRDGVMKAAEGCDIVIHLAANPNLWARDSRDFEAVNHQGTRNVLDAAARAKAGRTIYVSTESILTPRRKTEVISESVKTQLSDMIGPYCRSKWLAEQAAFESAANGQDVVIVRPSVPIGPGDRKQGPLTRMMNDFKEGRVKGWMPGDINLIDVRDVADGIIASIEHGESGEAYLLVNENWTIRALLNFLGEVHDRRPPRFKVPYSVALGFAYLEEANCRLRRNGHVPMATVTGIKLTRRCFRFDGKLSREKLGIGTMRSCRDAIREMSASASNEIRD